MKILYALIVSLSLVTVANAKGGGGGGGHASSGGHSSSSSGHSTSSSGKAATTSTAKSAPAEPVRTTPTSSWFPLWGHGSSSSSQCDKNKDKKC